MLCVCPLVVGHCCSPLIGLEYFFFFTPNASDMCFYVHCSLLALPIRHIQPCFHQGCYIVRYVGVQRLVPHFVIIFMFLFTANSPKSVTVGLKMMLKSIFNLSKSSQIKGALVYYLTAYSPLWPVALWIHTSTLYSPFPTHHLSVVLCNLLPSVGFQSALPWRLLTFSCWAPSLPLPFIKTSLTLPSVPTSPYLLLSSGSE